MNISLLKILHNRSWDIRPDVAQGYANALKNAMELHIENDVVKQKGYFLSMKGTKTAKGNFQDKLYVDNIHYVLNRLDWDDEELADDDQIINVVWIDGPVTRDGGACSYGSKDWRDQVIYANTIPQVIGHLFIINTPGGESSCRYDYDEIIADCRKNNKATVAYVDGMCCSSGVNLASRCDRVVVRNPKDEYGCIGSMAAFWATPDGAHDIDGTRYIEIVGHDSPEKNAISRNAANGDYEKLQALIDKGTREFHQTVRDNRPLVEDWMLSGEVFHADEVIPALVDEIGNMERAIECVQELVAGTLTAARFAKKEESAADPDEKPANNPEEKPEGGPKQEVSHQINNHMTDEEMKAMETASAKAAQEQAAPAQNQQEAEPKPDAPANEDPENEPEDDPDGDACNPGKKKDEDDSDDDACNPGKKKDEDDSDGDACNPGKKKDEGDSDDDACNPGKKKDEEDQEENPENDPGKQEANDLAKAQSALHTAEDMIADKDSKIADLQNQLEAKSKENSRNLAAIAEREKDIKERDEQIAKLNKQVAELKKEVSEIAAAPTPMNDAEGGVPADNGVGAPDTGSVKSIVNANMSADEIRKQLREQDAKMAEKRRRR
ncbi:MAG: S49 family peptidase [Prevotella sp.]|nr:S49 family peptidase [Prevotella sp.]